MTTLLRAIGIFVIVAAATISPVATSAQEVDGGSLWEKLNTIQLEQGQEAADAQFAQLSGKEQQAVFDYMSDTVTSEEVSVDIDEAQGSSLAATCWEVTRSIVVKQSWTGVVFYRYHQYMYWCGNGSYPFNRSCSAWPSDTGWGYWFEGHITYCQLVSQGYYFNFFSQGKFCAGAYFCQITGTPWIRQNGGASGEYWSSYGY